MDFRIRYVGEVDSTNTRVKALAQEGEREGLVLVADRQTAGYGRHARVFFSPDWSGLYFSLLLRPRCEVTRLPMLTVAAAVALSRAAEAVSGRRTEIKWVNDVYLDGKKLAGILVESALCADGTPDYAVLGIGINLFPPEGGFPARLSGATALFDPSEREAFLARRDELLSAFLRELTPLYANLSSLCFVEEYRRRSFLIGKEVRVFSAAEDAERAGEGRPALVLDVTADASLLVRYGDGTEAALSSAEVTLSL